MSRSKDRWPRAYSPPLDPTPESPNGRPLTHNGRVRLVGEGDTTPVNPMRDFIPGAEWWLCKSRKSVGGLLRDFSSGNVGCVLYERVGAMLPRGTDGQLFLIAIQLVRLGGEEDDWDLDLCLSEVGVFMEEIIVDILA